MLHKKLTDSPVEKLTEGEGTSKQVLISANDAPHFAMRRFIIEAGGHMPMHSNTVEHEQFCLAGEAEVVIGDKIIRVKKNDVVFIPAGIPHSYKTVSQEPFEFLCLVPNKEDIIEIVTNT